MPTYEYKCTNCGNMFELFQSINSETVTACTQCNSTAQRMISAGIGLIFKGTGFYITDYKNANSSPASHGGNGNGNGKNREFKKQDMSSKENYSKENSSNGKKETSKKETAKTSADTK